MTTQTQITISGFIVGTSWMPAVECWKAFRYDLTREDKCFNEPGTLRDHVTRITNDGDFRNCTIAHGVLTLTKNAGSRTRSRDFPLYIFPNVKDCMHDDPDWLPDYGDE